MKHKECVLTVSGVKHSAGLTRVCWLYKSKWHLHKVLFLNHSRCASLWHHEASVSNKSACSVIWLLHSLQAEFMFFTVLLWILIGQLTLPTVWGEEEKAEQQPPCSRPQRWRQTSKVWNLIITRASWCAAIRGINHPPYRTPLSLRCCCCC